MQLQQSKDYEIAYASQDDQEGYYTLTEEAREQVEAMFGRR